LAEVDAKHAELIEALGSEDRPKQRQACDELARRLPGDPDLRQSLLARLRDAQPQVRFAAAWILFQSERPSLRLLPALLDALELEDGDVRWSAAHMLATLGRLQGEVFPVLLHELANAASELRRRMALYALRELAPERPETCHAFLAALDDSSPDLRRAALSSLGKLHEPTLACLEQALAALDRDPDPRARRIAAAVLPPLATRHPDSLPAAREALRTAADSTDPSLARSARAALTRLPSPEA
jgi:HEAT repeat protein